MPESLTPEDRALIERVLGYREFDPNGGCWLWSGYTSPGGYGAITVKGRARRVHRVSYETFVGPIPEGMFVCHKCDVPACFNPSHLFVGTCRDNNVDAVRKGRHVRPLRNEAEVRHPRGTRSPAAKLNDDVVREIRRSHIGSTTLAKTLGVDDSLIRRIRRGKAWAHVR